MWYDNIKDKASKYEQIFIVLKFPFAISDYNRFIQIMQEILLNFFGGVPNVPRDKITL